MRVLRIRRASGVSSHASNSCSSTHSSRLNEGLLVCAVSCASPAFDLRVGGVAPLAVDVLPALLRFVGKIFAPEAVPSFACFDSPRVLPEAVVSTFSCVGSLAERFVPCFALLASALDDAIAVGVSLIVPRSALPSALDEAAARVLPVRGGTALAFDVLLVWASSLLGKATALAASWGSALPIVELSAAVLSAISSEWLLAGRFLPRPLSCALDEAPKSARCLADGTPSCNGLSSSSVVKAFASSPLRGGTAVLEAVLAVFSNANVCLICSACFCVKNGHS